MRIGIFTDTYPPDTNGVATSVQLLEDELKKHGHEVYIVTSSSNKTISRKGNIIMIPGVTFKRLYGFSVSNFYSFFGVRYLKKLNLDLIHAQTEYGIGIFARIFATSAKLPLVYTYHTMYEDYTNYMTKFTKGHFEGFFKKAIVGVSKLYAEKCTELIVPSNKTKEAMLRYGVTTNINVIPTGINLDKFAKDNYDEDFIKKLRSKYVGNEDFLALYLGRIAPEKNLQEIFDAFVELKKQGIKNIKMVIVGSGPYLSEYRKYIKENNIDDLIQMIGRVSYDEVPKYYHMADLFISTSTSETQGLTFIEAMASGLPVICHYDDNLVDIINDGVNGYFIYDYKQLTERIKDVANIDQAKYDSLVEQAYQTAQQYSSAKFYDSVMEVYANALANSTKWYNN